MNAKTCLVHNFVQWTRQLDLCSRDFIPILVRMESTAWTTPFKCFLPYCIPQVSPNHICRQTIYVQWTRQLDLRSWDFCFTVKRQESTVARPCVNMAAVLCLIWVIFAITEMKFTQNATDWLLVGAYFTSTPCLHPTFPIYRQNSSRAYPSHYQGWLLWFVTLVTFA